MGGSNAPVLDSLLPPLLPAGKVILSSPSETNAYITKEAQTNCGRHGCGPLQCARASLCVCVFVSWKPFCALLKHLHQSQNLITPHERSPVHAATFAQLIHHQFVCLFFCSDVSFEKNATGVYSQRVCSGLKPSLRDAGTRAQTRKLGTSPSRWVLRNARSTERH